MRMEKQDIPLIKNTHFEIGGKMPLTFGKLDSIKIKCLWKAFETMKGILPAARKLVSFQT